MTPLDRVEEIAKARTEGSWTLSEDNKDIKTTTKLENKTSTFVCESATKGGWIRLRNDLDFLALSANIFDELLAVAKTANDVKKFDTEEWKNDVDRGDATMLLYEALENLNSAIERVLK